MKSRNEYLLFSLLLALVFPVCVGTAVPDDARVILHEDFESYADTASMTAIWKEGTSVLSADVPGGGKAALHDGGDLNSRRGFSAQPDARNNVLFSADIYDSAPADESRVTVALRNDSGANLEFGHIYEAGPYAMRIAGFAEPTDWISFGPDLKPQIGWNRYQAIISLTNTVVTIDLGADGTIDKTLTFAGPTPRRSFTNIRFGGLPGRKSHSGPLLVDDIRLALVSATNPAPTPVARTAVTSMNATVSTARDEPTNTVAALTAVATGPEETTGKLLWWIGGALTIIIVLLGAMVFLLRRSSHAGPMAVAKIPSGIPERFPSELTEFAKQELVQGLYGHRKALIEVQKRAHQEIIELEARLASLELPLNGRICAYEKRIAELEKELESRTEETRELAKATLLLVREKLEKEKKNERFDRLN